MPKRFRVSMIALSMIAVAGCAGLVHPQPPKLPPGKNHKPAETINLETGTSPEFPKLN